MHNQTCLAADPLRAQAAEILGQAERLEELIEGAAAWSMPTRAQVEARATLEQAEELRRPPEGLGKRQGG
jgi:hypothetical protein